MEAENRITQKTGEDGYDPMCYNYIDGRWVFQHQKEMKCTRPLKKTFFVVVEYFWEKYYESVDERKIASPFYVPVNKLKYRRFSSLLKLILDFLQRIQREYKN